MEFYQEACSEEGRLGRGKNKSMELETQHLDELQMVCNGLSVGSCKAEMVELTEQSSQCRSLKIVLLCYLFSRREAFHRRIRNKNF